MRPALFLLALPVLMLAAPSAFIEADTAEGGTLEEPVRVLWDVRYDGPASDLDIASSIAVSPDGETVFVTGESDGLSNLQDYATLAYDVASGKEIWNTRSGLPFVLDRARSLAVSPDGATVFVTGDSDWDYLSLAYDAYTGKELWRARYTGSSSTDIPESLAVSPDGSMVFVTGRSRDDRTGSIDYVTVAYHATTGEEAWNVRYGGRDSRDIPLSLAVSPDGATVFVTGRSGGLAIGYDTSDYATLAYDAATGEQIWIARYDGTGLHSDDHGEALAVSPDGAVVIVTGHSRGVGTGWNYATVAYDATTGEELWSARYGSHGDDYGKAIAVSPDSSTVFVTGTSPRTGELSDYATCAYNVTTGEQIWSVRYDGPRSGTDDADSIAVSPDGSTVVVTGTSQGTGTELNYLTVAYDAATGEQIWSARGEEAAYFSVPVKMSLNGSHVFVTGTTEHVATHLDYATLAYAPVFSVEIDIKPGSHLNNVNPRSRGVIPIAILGSATFDVTDVDVGTLRFAKSQIPPKHDGQISDVDLDGFMDLVIHHPLQDSGITCGDAEASLSGQTLEGRFIQGTDSIRTVGCK